MEMKKLLAELTALPGVTGRESLISRRLAELCAPLCDKACVDKLGNVIGMHFAAKQAAPVLVLDAHIDSVGMFVTGVDDDGFLRFRCVGIDPRVLPDREVWILSGKNERRFGVITCMPPHLQKAEDAGKATEIKDMAIDAGFSKKDALDKIPLGAAVMFCTELCALNGDTIAGASLDDRAGFAVLLRVLERLRNVNTNVTVMALGSVGEETGGMGTITGSYNIAPEYGIVVDVTHGTTPDSKPGSAFKVGSGPSIGIGPNLHRGMTDKMIATAEAMRIPYTKEILARGSGTNAEELQIARGGVACALVSLPLKYMHTPQEVMCIGDIEKSAELIAGFILDFDPEKLFDRLGY